MKAIVYQGPGSKALLERPRPQLTAPTAAVVRLTKTTICGADLNTLKGDVPSRQPGRTVGHARRPGYRRRSSFARTSSRPAAALPMSAFTA